MLSKMSLKDLKHFLYLLSILTTSRWVYCIEESYCAGTGFLDGNGKPQGVKSLGWSKFKKDPHSRVFGSNHANLAQGSLPAISMDIRKVEDQGRELSGWLQLNILKRDAKKVLVIAVWAVTDTRESIGEFISPKTAKCASLPALTYNDENIVPCAATPINEPTNPNMFVYLHNNDGKGVTEFNLLWRTSVSYCNFPKKFRFLIAANTNRFSESLPFFKLTQGQFGPRIYASKWIHPNFYGSAAAPIYDAYNLKCKTSIKNSKPKWIKTITATTAPTSDGRELVEVENGWVEDRWTGNENKPTENQNVVDRRRGCKPKSGEESFAGRCTTKVDPNTGATNVNKEALHKCDTNNNLDASDLSVLKGTYEDYLKKREKTLKDNCDCPPIPTPEEVRQAAGGTGRKKRWIMDDAYHDDDEEEHEINDDDDQDNEEVDAVVWTESVERAGQIKDSNKEIDPPVRPYGENQFSKCKPTGVRNDSYTKDEQGLCVTSISGKIAYGVRQWHASSILFGIVVLSPVTSYMARYLKGTFSLTGKAPIPVKKWYIVHISLVLPMVCMCTTGMAAIYRQRQVLGYSYSIFAKFHRISGNCIFAAGMFEMISGVFRPKNLLLRKVFIALHWFGGIVIKYLGLAICILSYRIPASPTAFVPHVNRKKFGRIWSHMAPIILVAYGIVEVLFQIFMTLHVLKFDRKFAIKRSHFPIIIPLMVDVDNQASRINDEFEKEQSFHRAAFTMYVVLCFLTYVLTCVAIYNLNSTSNEQSFGPMLCSHNQFGMFLDPNAKPIMVHGYC